MEHGIACVSEGGGGGGGWVERSLMTFTGGAFDVRRKHAAGLIASPFASAHRQQESEMNDKTNKTNKANSVQTYHSYPCAYC